MASSPHGKKTGQSPSDSAEMAFIELMGDGVPVIDRSLPAVPQICDILRQMILQLRLEPGSVISKNEVAQALGVSSMPVREALRKLEEEGLVVIKPQSGTYVAAIDVDWAWEAQFLRIGVEVEVVKKVAETASAEDIRELEQILRHQYLEAESDNKEGFNRDDAAFHAALYRMAGVARLWKKIGT
ncbi:MAG: GntR family transcriptional regulator, partial [Rhodospirillales bacterium]|nr:GntR family transcriptional regulator [Rhodospirillales bacterium]